MSNDFITIKNARVHNLKGVDVQIPANKLVVITGLSGSGKSSLAFDTLYAEGQRRYVESLSSYVRQFLGRINKPEVDLIKGIPPAIAIEQKVISNNPRSTVGTSTEIYDFLKLLFARIGRTYSPVSGKEVKRHTAEDVIAHITSLPENTVALLLAPLPEDRIKKGWQILVSQGFARIMNGEDILMLSDLQQDKAKLKKRKNYIVIDRVRANKTPELRNRLYDSVATAFFEGNDICFVAHKEDDKMKFNEFSKAFQSDGIKFVEPTEQMFAFNNPIGMCPKCDGFGRVLGIDPDLVVPDKSLSIYDGAVLPWRGPVMGRERQNLIANAEKFDFPIHTPYYKLTAAEQRLIWTGNEYFQGLDDLFAEIEKNRSKIQFRAMLAHYRGKTVCPECDGTRLRKEVEYVKINGLSINTMVNMSVGSLHDFFSNIRLTDEELHTAERLLREIKSRLKYLIDVGLEYLTLNRLSNTLSGGESQRINLAKQLGSSLVGSLYILDEPSIGLHPRDTERLISVLRSLQQLGNTVVVVEHDEDIMRAADYIIDIGPEAGINGGQIVMAANVNELSTTVAPQSYTLQYLTGARSIALPARRKRSANYIEISDIEHNNLHGTTLRVPLGIITAVTGVSGSGKSSLISDVLYNALTKHFSGDIEENVTYKSLTGSLHLITGVEKADQNPIGKSSRSNPATYIKAFDEIRRLFAEQPLAKTMNYTAGTFSFNVDGGRCPVCLGEGSVTMPMQFMADLSLTCEECNGKRFKRDVLDVKYRDKNIYDVLEMSVDQAIDFFSEDSRPTASRIVERLKPLQDVGIGYIKLGQSSSTLSGGENQRIKLASYLSRGNDAPKLFIFDEPTTGLHTHDIANLMKAFRALTLQGHTIVVIEHNLNVIKSADYIIDIGPEGGDKGGKIVAEGTPEQIAKCRKSHTGEFLKKIL